MAEGLLLLFSCCKQIIARGTNGMVDQVNKWVKYAGGQGVALMLNCDYWNPHRGH